MRVGFGDCVLDTDTRQLFRAERAVALSRKAFDLLALLLRQRPHVVTKATLQEQLWPGTFVLEANLPNIVAEVRSAIGDTAREPRFIRTVHGFGYAFSGAARDLSTPRLTSLDKAIYCASWQGEKVLLGEGDHLIGRSPECRIWLRSPTVSRRHARLRITAGAAVLEDLGSMNGTVVKGQPVKEPVTLTDDEEIVFGSVPVRLQAFALSSITETIRR